MTTEITTAATPMIGFDGERLARASLTYLAEPGDERLGVLTDAYGAVPVLEAIKANRILALPAKSGSAQSGPARSGPTLFEPTPFGSAPADSAPAGSTSAGSMPSGSAAAAARKALERWRSRLDELPTADSLERLCRQGIRLVCPGDPEWPTRLDDLGAGRPYALWLRGREDLRFSCLRSLSIVGSRAATAYGSYMASEIAASVAARGWTVVSGAAYGVDGAAHSGTLGSGGRTVAVLACGVDLSYPVGHRDLLDAIAEGGVVASEWPPGRHPSRLRFLVRNRVIAALSLGTLVVEAGERSGALNTGRHARDLGRCLMAVPGPVTSEQSRGCHTIIQNWGGILVTGADDALEVVTPLGEKIPPEPAKRDEPADPDERAAGRAGEHAERPAVVLPRDRLDHQAAAVLGVLPVRGGLGTTAVAAKAGLPPADVLRLLGELTAGGFAERSERGWRVRRP